MQVNLPNKAKNDWIALFESDLSSQCFDEKACSDDVIYWIRRSGNRQTHTARSTGNIYELRSYSVFDKLFEPSAMKWDNWTCISITETMRDFYGCAIKIEIVDCEGIVKAVYASTSVDRNYLKEHQLMSCIMYYLFSLQSYKSWAEVLVSKENIDYYDKLINGRVWIPSFITYTIYNRLSNISRFWWPQNFKWDHKME